MTPENVDISLNISTTPGPSPKIKRQKQKPRKRIQIRKSKAAKISTEEEDFNFTWQQKSDPILNKKSNSEENDEFAAPTLKDLRRYMHQAAAGVKSTKIFQTKGAGKTGQTDEVPEKGVKRPSSSIGEKDAFVKHKKFKGDNENVKEGKKFGKTSEKVASLFGSNPTVPTVGQRLVRPITEEVFSGSKFSDLDVHPYAVKNLLDNLKIVELTTVQKRAIPVLLNGQDALIRSQTGSGKTLAYALPIIESLQSIRPKLNRTNGLRALIIVPTHELALQTYELLVKLVKPFTWLVPGYLCGGEKRKAEKARLRRGITILVGTPGRLLDHIQHTNSLKLDKVKFLILDEADRMLDMGYERDVKSLIEALQLQQNSSGYDPIALLKNSIKKFPARGEEDQDHEEPDATSAGHDDTEDISSSKEKMMSIEKFDKRQLQTVLLSATLTSGVQKLAGLTLKQPQQIDVSNLTTSAPSKTNQIPINAGDMPNNDVEQLVIPESVAQKYMVTPPKLRLAALSSYIIAKANSENNCKMLIFMATQDMVDYHIELFSAVLIRGDNDKVIPADDDDEEIEDFPKNKRKKTAEESEDDQEDSSDEDDGNPLVNVEFFKLHGSMTQKERTEVFKIFRAAKTGVLICTDVAARGLDLPRVDCIAQYTGPISGADYVHRVGRTARAGSKGEAILFLTPSEVQFVRELENRRIRIKQEKMDLGPIETVLEGANNAEIAASQLQQRYETAVLDDKRLKNLAQKAYTSWVRFYACYPREMRSCFNIKDLHLGHYAKSFGLRDPPSAIGGTRVDNFKPKQHGDKAGNTKRNDSGWGGKSGFPQSPKLGRTKRLIVSEFESGLAPSKKKKQLKKH